MHVATTISHSAEETFELGRRRAESLRGGEVLALVGELGAGKTHFVKGLAAGLACRANVTSPTFVLIHEYVDGRLPLYHFDFYRLESEEEVRQIGLDDYLHGNGVVVVEWADKFPSLLPADACWMRFRFVFEGREISAD